MAKDLKPTTAAELEGLIFSFVVMKHPSFGEKELVFKVRKGIPATLLMQGRAAMPNPMLAAVEDPKEPKEDKDAGLAYLQAIAEGAMVEPTYGEVKHLIGTDLYILAAIVKEATGLKVLGDAFTGAIFRKGPETPGNPKK